MGAKLGHSVHPHEGHFAQGPQFAGLGVSAEQLDVLANRSFQHFVAGQFWSVAKVARGLAFGGGVFHALVHHELRRRGGDFLRNTHGSCTPAMRASMVAARFST